MDIVCGYKDIIKGMYEFGIPISIKINPNDEEFLNYTFPSFYKRESIKNSYNSGNLGYFKEVPVKEGYWGSRKVKLIYD